MKKQNHVQTQVTWTKYQILKIQDGGRPPFWKSLYLGRESSDFDEIWCADSNFGSRTVTCWFIKKLWNSKWRTAAILQMVSSLYLSRGSSDFNEIWCATAEFGSKDCHVTKYQNFANSKWWQPPYWKSFLAISQRFIVQLTWNLIWRSRITFRYRSHDQNSKMWKFKMVDDRHFENGFITISQLRIIRFQWNLVCHCIIWFKEWSIIKVSKFSKFKMADGRFVGERLYVGLQISWVLWANQRCPEL